MSLISLSMKHGTSQEEARAQLEKSVEQVRGQFASVIRTTIWSEDKNLVKITGTGFELEMRVDAQEVHVKGDLPFLGNLLGGPVMNGLKGIVEKNFHKRLT